MAKKTTNSKSSSNSTTNYGIVKMTAFWGMIISGIVSIITLIIKLLVVTGLFQGAGATLNKVVSVFNLIANIALFISVFLAGYAHSRGKSKVWRTLFLVFSIIAFLGILGLNIMNMF